MGSTGRVPSAGSCATGKWMWTCSLRWLLTVTQEAKIANSANGTTNRRMPTYTR